MKNLSELRGQKIAQKLLESYLEKNAPPLLLFAGPEGTGKWSAAEAFVQQSLCEVGTSCGTCPACRKVQSGNHPDFIQFPEEKIGIGEPEDPEEFTIRWLLKTRICYSPFDGKRRFVIFPRADLIQNEAETALLKTLEEPPEHTRFIFLTRSLEELKPTVISRSVVVPFSLLAKEDLTQLGEIPEEYLELLGGSLQLLPYFYTEHYSLAKNKIKEGLGHPLELLKLEKWLLSGEKKSFADVMGEETFTYVEILDIFSMLLLKHCEEHPEKEKLRDIIFDFKGDLHMEMAGMHPYLLSRLFHKLGRQLFK